MTASISALTAVARLLDPTAPSSASLTPMLSWSAVQGGVLGAVATKLGLSQSDLTTQLKTGKSLSQLATAAGVSSSDLSVTIQEALAQSDLPAGVNLAAMATRMANNVNNASLVDSTPTAASTATASTGSGLGIDTSALGDFKIGGLSLDSSEISMLLGGDRSGLDAYL